MSSISESVPNGWHLWAKRPSVRAGEVARSLYLCICSVQGQMVHDDEGTSTRGLRDVSIKLWHSNIPQMDQHPLGDLIVWNQAFKLQGPFDVPPQSHPHSKAAAFINEYQGQTAYELKLELGSLAIFLRDALGEMMVAEATCRRNIRLSRSPSEPGCSHMSSW